MLLKIETEILGDFSTEMDMKIKHHPYDIDIRFEDETKRFFISICRKVTDYYANLPQIVIDHRSISQITFPSQNFIEDQMEILQHIESFGAIDKAVEKLNCQNGSNLSFTVENRQILIARNANDS